MTLLTSYSTDDIIAEIQRRLDEGTVGYHGLLSTNQADHRDMWVDLRLYVADLRNKRPDDATLIDVEREMFRLIDERTARGVFAVNTTFHGREAMEDHAPRVAA